MVRGDRGIIRTTRPTEMVHVPNIQISQEKLMEMFVRLYCYVRHDKSTRNQP